MFSKSPQRNFEWFEITFTKKLQAIISENNQDSISWIRDLFISLLLAMFSLLCQLLDNEETLPILATILKWGTIISIAGLIIWFLICIIKYNKRIKKIKSRIIPHSIKNSYTLDESVQLFDNDICNELVLSKNYIELAYGTTDSALAEFYVIEAIHYYFKSIRMFNIICNSNSLTELFSSESGNSKNINMIRLVNYIKLVNSTLIDKSKFICSIDFTGIDNYNASYQIVKEAFITTANNLKESYADIPQLNVDPNEIIDIIS